MSRSMPATAGTPSKDLQSLRSSIAPPVTGSTDLVAEPGEVRDEPVDVGVAVLDREQPLLDLPPWRQEHATVVLDEPVRLAEPVVDLEEVPVLANRVGAERDAALRADAHDVPVEAVLGDRLLEAGAHPRGERVEVGVAVVGEHLGERRAGRRHGERVAVEGADLLVAA